MTAFLLLLAAVLWALLSGVPFAHPGLRPACPLPAGPFGPPWCP